MACTLLDGQAGASLEAICRSLHDENRDLCGLFRGKNAWQ